MFGLTRNQVIAISIAILSVLSGATAQLTDLFGAYAAKTIVSASSLVTTALSSIMAVLTSQGTTTKEFLNQPGVEHVSINEKANSTLAAIAVDPQQPKIAPTQQATAQVEATAKGV